MHDIFTRRQVHPSVCVALPPVPTTSVTATGVTSVAASSAAREETPINNGPRVNKLVNNPPHKKCYD
jgi:hypothetical protein